MPAIAARKQGSDRKRTTAKKRFGRAGTAGKGEGPEAVEAWLAGVPAGQQAVARKLDGLISQMVPGVRRAVKWSMAFYGLKGKGWIAHIASYKGYVSLGFFAGTKLDPPPPSGEGKGMRRANLRSMADLDETQVRAWLKQAVALPGWGSV